MTDEDKKITEKRCREADEVGAGDGRREEKWVSDRPTKSRGMYNRAMIISERRILCQKRKTRKCLKSDEEYRLMRWNTAHEKRESLIGDYRKREAREENWSVRRCSYAKGRYWVWRRKTTHCS